MADDWDTVTKIGSKARGGASQRETVIRGKSALNAAQRSGAIVGTEKKMSAGNSASKPTGDGQFKTKLDRADDVVPLKKVDTDVGKAISKARQEMVPKCTQKALAEKCSVKLQEIASFEGGKVLPNPQQTGTLERILKVHLTGANIGDEIERFKKGDAKKPVTKTADPKAATKTSAK